MRRRGGNGSTREHYLAELRYLDRRYGADFDHPWARQISDRIGIVTGGAVYAEDASVYAGWVALAPAPQVQVNTAS